MKEREIGTVLRLTTTEVLCYYSLYFQTVLKNISISKLIFELKKNYSVILHSSLKGKGSFKRHLCTIILDCLQSAIWLRKASKWQNWHCTNTIISTGLAQAPKWCQGQIKIWDNPKNDSEYSGWFTFSFTLCKG